MKLDLSVAARCLTVFGAVVMLGESAGAQYARPATQPLQDQWENQRIRVTRLSAEPGAAIRGSDADRVVVYLTADPDGRLSPAEAVWQPAGSGALENRGRARLEAILIELKDAPDGTRPGTPPEALMVSRGAEVRHLVDNSRVMVTKHRYAPTTTVDPLHFHPEDVLVVYLRGGHIWPVAATWGAQRVRRGDLDIVPANTLHAFGNAGSDPLEFLVVIPR